tara:strand:- start:235 stop:459 length:225 start_codon:yes stop_codon:yes gene_type:complete
MFSEDINFMNDYVKSSLNSDKELKKSRIDEYFLLKDKLDKFFNKLFLDDIPKEELQKDITYIKEKINGYYQLIK